MELWVSDLEWGQLQNETVCLENVQVWQQSFLQGFASRLSNAASSQDVFVWQQLFLLEL
jgi:hypothetical protein